MFDLSDPVFIALILAMLAVFIVSAIILLKKLRPKNDRNAEASGGVDMNDPLFGLTGEITGKKHYHTGTLVVRGAPQRIKISIYNCRTNTDTVMYVVTEIRIGRAPEKDAIDPNAYRIDGDTMISTVHCSLLNYAGSLAVRDNNSKNHTYLNSQMIEGVVYVNSGDRLTIGQTDLVINIL